MPGLRVPAAEPTRAPREPGLELARRPVLGPRRLGDRVAGGKAQQELSDVVIERIE